MTTDLQHLPEAIGRLVNLAASRTQLQPGRAAAHALELDQQLRLHGWAAPLTYSAWGWAMPGKHSDLQAPCWRESPAAYYRCLHDAEQRSKARSPDVVAQAYLQARGPEIAALNLVYANDHLALEGLWLKFLNKYLSYFGYVDGLALRPLTQASTSQARGMHTATRFGRLTPAKVATPAHGPTVSVLMPIYNAEATLAQAAHSILQQSWRSLELILIDDCSQDGSLALAHDLARADPRVKVLPLSTNAGPYVAKNLALSVAQGQYLTVHDADDLALPDRIALQLAPLLHGAGTAGNPDHLAVTMGRALRLQADGRLTRFGPIDWVSVDGAMRLCFPSPLFRRDYFDQRIGAWDDARVGADAELFQRIQRFDPKSLKILDTVVMLQLDSPTSLTRAADTYNDERGEAPGRKAYREAWMAWHAKCDTMPKIESRKFASG